MYDKNIEIKCPTCNIYRYIKPETHAQYIAQNKSFNCRSCAAQSRKLVKQQLLFCDLTDQIFGDMKATHYIGRYLWECYCIKCGVVAEIRGRDLRIGQRTRCWSCGYLESAHKALYRRYEYSAQKRGVEFALTFIDFKKYLEQNCSYCGIAPNTLFTNGKPITLKRTKSQCVYNGIDRLDSNKGYTIDNIATCCSDCNYGKQESSLDDFKQWITKVYNYLQLG